MPCCPLTVPIKQIVCRGSPSDAVAQGHGLSMVVSRLGAGRLSSDYAEPRELRWLSSLAWGFRIAIQDRFHTQDSFAVAHPTSIRAGVGNGVAVFAIDCLTQRYATDFRLHRELKDFRHGVDPLRGKPCLVWFGVRVDCGHRRRITVGIPRCG